MKTAFVFGHRSKMGQSLLGNLPKTLQLISLEDFEIKGADYLFLTGKKKDSFEFLRTHGDKAKKVLDFSGATKFLALTKEKGYVYALDDEADRTQQKVISFPGCASWGLISVLKALGEALPSKVYATASFPQSALGRDSKNKDLAFIHPLSHLQEMETNLFFKKTDLVSLCPMISPREMGLTFSIMFSSKEDVKEILRKNLGKELVLCDLPSEVVPQEDKVLVHVSSKEETVCIIGAVNNLVGRKFLRFL